MTNRRRFLALLGVGTAAGPLAAKEAIEAEQIKLTSIGTRAVLSGSIGGIPAADGDDESVAQMARTYVRLFGVPAHIERLAQEHARYVANLDYDIASKRSWSLAAKVHEQRQRNYAREMERYRDFNWYGSAQTAFKKVSGFKWPW